MTTVSAPVFDRRNHSVNILIFFFIISYIFYNTNFALFFNQERAANLLGVVGMDVYIDDLKKLVPAYKVNRIFFNAIMTKKKNFNV